MGVIVLAGALPPAAALFRGFRGLRRRRPPESGPSAPPPRLVRRVCVEDFGPQVLEPTRIAWLRGASLATGLGVALGGMFGGFASAAVLGSFALLGSVALGLPALLVALGLARVAAGGVAKIDEVLVLRSALRDPGAGHVGLLLKPGEGSLGEPEQTRRG